MSSDIQHPKKTIDRRTLLKAGAWSTPAIIAMTALPGAAASGGTATGKLDFTNVSYYWAYGPGGAVVGLTANTTVGFKHGGTGTEAKVSFSWTRDGLQLLVDDDGIRAKARRAGLDSDAINRDTAYTIDDDLHALTSNFSGAGLTQMKQRAELYGGVFQARTVPGVGFSVSVIFPALRFHNGVHSVNLAR